MITCIVTSLGKGSLMASPMDQVDLPSLVGRVARYLDKNGKVWPAKVEGMEDPFLIIRFTGDFPTGIGQGQMVDVIEDGDDINSA